MTKKIHACTRLNIYIIYTLIYILLNECQYLKKKEEYIAKLP